MGLCCQIVIWDVSLSTSSHSTLSLPAPSLLEKNPSICLSTPTTSKATAHNLPDSSLSHPHKQPLHCLSNIINQYQHHPHCWPIFTVVIQTTCSSFITAFTINIIKFALIVPLLPTLPYCLLPFLVVINHGNKTMAYFIAGVTFIFLWGEATSGTCVPSYFSQPAVPGCTTLDCSACRRTRR